MSAKRKRQTVFKYDCEVSISFQQDCETLLKKFESFNTTSFSKFCEAWKEINFTLVYSTFETALPLMEFVDNSFFTVKKFIIFSKSKLIQIGAFYLLYGLYYKQPLKHWVKIRVTVDEFKVIKKLITQAIQDLKPEIMYIFAKMMQDNAFLYVATKRSMGFEDSYTRSVHNYEDDTFEHRATESVFGDFNTMMESTDSSVRRMEEIDRKYNELLEFCPNESRGLIKSSTSSTLGELNQLYISINDTTKIAEKEKPSETIVKKRKQIKQKAMGMCNRRYRDKKLISGNNVSQKNCETDFDEKEV